MECDELSKELLSQNESSGALDMEGKAEDETRVKLVDAIIDTIAKDTLNEAVVREVEFLSNIQLFQRGNTETVPTFVNRYKNAIARYVNQTSQLSEFENRQFAIIMLRNTNLSSNTMNTVTFQLTTNANKSVETHPNFDISLSAVDARCVKEIIGKMALPPDECKEILCKIKKADEENSERPGYMFNMEDTSQSLSQVKSYDIVDNMIPRTASMLVKRTHAYTTGKRRQDLKNEGGKQMQGMW